MKIIKIIRWVILSIFLIYLALFVSEFIYASFMVYPQKLALPTGLFLCLLGSLVILLHPSASAIAKNISKVAALLSLVSLLSGSAYDFYQRNNLASRIKAEESIQVGFERMSSELSSKEKQKIINAIEKDKIIINWFNTFENLLGGYNSCSCGRGLCFYTKDGNLLYSTKHTTEMLINGFISFEMSLDIWYGNPKESITMKGTGSALELG